MGYYSEVAIEITKDEEAKFLEMIENHVSPYEGFYEQDDNTNYNHAKVVLEWADRQEHIDYLWNEMYTKREPIDVVVYYWDEVKWYYDGPNTIEKFVKQLDNFGFCRVGEELGDCEREYGGRLDETLLDIHSYISINE